MINVFLVVVILLTAFMLYGAWEQITETGWETSDYVFVPVIGYAFVQAGAYLVLGIPGVSQ